MNWYGFQPRNWTATVEKVATIAVMAGCKPEHLPVVLAIAESGCPIEHPLPSQWVCVSGPIVKEIGMNSGLGMLGPRQSGQHRLSAGAYQMMAINLGGAIPGVNRMSSIGSPFNHGGLLC